MCCVPVLSWYCSACAGSRPTKLSSEHRLLGPWARVWVRPTAEHPSFTVRRCIFATLKQPLCPGFRVASFHGTAVPGYKFFLVHVHPCRDYKYQKRGHTGPTLGLNRQYSLLFSQRTEVVAGPRNNTQLEQKLHCCRPTEGCAGAVAPLVVRVIFVFF